MSADQGKHSPGPWEWNDPATYKQGYGKFGEVAVYAPGNVHHWRMAEIVGPDDETTIANARLIAAAPELFVALKALVFYFTDDGQHCGKPELEVFQNARAAIAKAEGVAESASVQTKGE